MAIRAKSQKKQSDGKVPFLFRVEPGLLRQAGAAARADGRSIAGWIRQAIRAALGRSGGA